MSNGPITPRREFLQRLWRAAALAAGAGALGLGFWDRQGPTGNAPSRRSLTLPDFSVAGQAGKIAVARGDRRHRNVAMAIEALGGMRAFVQPGDRVLLKVNAAFATPPLLSATTHPDVVLKVADACFKAGAAKVMVTDNPINDPASCFELTGIGPAARSAGAQLLLPNPDRFAPYSLPGGQLIRNWPLLAAPLLQADKVIGLAPLKNHHRSGASMTNKNWYGLLGGRRNIFHQQIHAIIAELAMLLKPTLVILDGTQSMMRNGPTGGSLDDLKATHVLIAGTDAVAVDTLGANVLGKTIEDLPHLRMAQEAGAGTVDFKSLGPIEVNSAV